MNIIIFFQCIDIDKLVKIRITDSGGLEGDDGDEVLVGPLGEGESSGGGAEAGELGEALAAANLQR